MNKKSKIEFLNIPKEEIDDYTKTSGSWEIKGEKYKFIETYLDGQGDGESHAVVQRESDGKYFEFGWCYDDGNYYYEPQWSEVKPRTITKTVYK